MLKVNEYFDGKVKSIGFANAGGNATVGVMAPGEYQFVITSYSIHYTKLYERSVHTDCLIDVIRAKPSQDVLFVPFV